MSEQQDRLALIARAGNRLRVSQDHHAIAPQRPSADETTHGNDVSRTDLREDLGLVRPAASITPLGTKSPPSAPVSDGAPPIRLRFPQLRREGMLTPDNMRSALGFEYRTIKRKLLANARSAHGQGRNNNLIMVTSARPSEGKTFTSTNLAISLAMDRDIRVLAIDGDVVRQKLSAMFEPSGGMGLLDLLKGRCKNIAEITHRCADLPNLDVVLSGRLDDRAPELLASRRMAEFCDDISTQYKDGIVILDTPPVLASPETVNLAAHVHQIVMVVASGQTTKSQLQLALDHVSACPNISLLLNKAPAWHKMDGDTYYYYGYYGARADGNEHPTPDPKA